MKRFTILSSCALLVATLGAGGFAHAATTRSCSDPATTTTVTPSGGQSPYTYTRGCIASFDGTPIVYNLFEPVGTPPSSGYPAILIGPGWGGGGATSPDANLISANYAELTWDPRGFGQSGGVAEVDSPSSEGRDVSALIDKVLTGRPEIAADPFGQPIVGMTGVSYGGGIEFATAGFDHRVRAIVPGWAWNNLDYSLFPGNVIKLGWDELLYGAGLAEGAASHAQGDVGAAPTLGGNGGIQTGGYDPNIHYAQTQGTAAGYPDEQVRAWFAQRSMVEYGAGPAGHVPMIPTLMIQGTVDTLFNLNDAWANYQEIQAHDWDDDGDLPVKMIAFCGGHVSCPTGAQPNGSGYSDTASNASQFGAGLRAAAFTENMTIAWFNCYLKGIGCEAVVAQPTVIYQDQTGDFTGASTFPTFANDPAAFSATSIPPATLVSTGAPGDTDTRTGDPGLVGGAPGQDAILTDGPSPGGPGVLSVPLTNLTSGTILGEPHVDLDVTVDGPGANLYFKLVDTTTNGVIDLQTGAIRLDNLDLANNLENAGAPQQRHVSLDLPGVAYKILAGHQIELQISTSSTSFSNFRGGAAVVQIAGGTLEVPSA